MPYYTLHRHKLRFCHFDRNDKKKLSLRRCLVYFNVRSRRFIAGRGLQPKFPTGRRFSYKTLRTGLQTPSSTVSAIKRYPRGAGDGVANPVQHRNVTPAERGTGLQTPVQHRNVTPAERGTGLQTPSSTEAIYRRFVVGDLSPNSRLLNGATLPHQHNALRQHFPLTL
jgi:hypothetical protein